MLSVSTRQKGLAAASIFFVVAITFVIVCLTASYFMRALIPGVIRAPASSSARAGNQDVPGQCMRGIAIQIQRVDAIERYKQSINEIAELGANVVSLTVDMRMETIRSDNLWLDWRMTPSSAMLLELIRHAKGRGLRVILVPIVQIDHEVSFGWRGHIIPADWSLWWDNYRAALLQFAFTAQEGGVDIFCVGAELMSSESQKEQWLSTIAAVRKAFHGPLTYEANWSHYAAVPFWDSLDFIGTNSFDNLSDGPGASVGDLQTRCREVQQRLMAFCGHLKKPLLVLEVGWCSLPNAADDPWDYTHVELPVDLDLQRRLYEAYTEVWYGTPNVQGIIFWEWPLDAGGPADRGYTPKNKPAESSLRRWFSRPPSAVHPAASPSN